MIMQSCALKLKIIFLLLPIQVSMQVNVLATEFIPLACTLESVRILHVFICIYVYL